MNSSNRVGFPNGALDAAAIKTAVAVGLVTLVLGLAMAIGLWMPGPFYDDAYFSGPAIRFATTGEMKNFLLDMDAIPKISDLPLFTRPFTSMRSGIGLCCSAAPRLQRFAFSRPWRRQAPQG